MEYALPMHHALASCVAQVRLGSVMVEENEPDLGLVGASMGGNKYGKRRKGVERGGSADFLYDDTHGHGDGDGDAVAGPTSTRRVQANALAWKQSGATRMRRRQKSGDDRPHGSKRSVSSASKVLGYVGSRHLKVAEAAGSEAPVLLDRMIMSAQRASLQVQDEEDSDTYLQQSAENGARLMKTVGGRASGQVEVMGASKRNGGALERNKRAAAQHAMRVGRRVSASKYDAMLATVQRYKSMSSSASSRVATANNAQRERIRGRAVDQLTQSWLDKAETLSREREDAEAAVDQAFRQCRMVLLESTQAAVDMYKGSSITFVHAAARANDGANGERGDEVVDSDRDVSDALDDAVYEWSDQLIADANHVVQNIAGAVKEDSERQSDREAALLRLRVQLIKCQKAVCAFGSAQRDGDEAGTVVHESGGIFIEDDENDDGGAVQAEPSRRRDAVDALQNVRLYIHKGLSQCGRERDEAEDALDIACGWMASALPWSYPAHLRQQWPLSEAVSGADDERAVWALDDCLPFGPRRVFTLNSLMGGLRARRAKQRAILPGEPYLHTFHRMLGSLEAFIGNVIRKGPALYDDLSKKETEEKAMKESESDATEAHAECDSDEDMLARTEDRGKRDFESRLVGMPALLGLVREYYMYLDVVDWHSAFVVYQELFALDAEHAVDQLQNAQAFLGTCEKLQADVLCGTVGPQGHLLFLEAMEEHPDVSVAERMARAAEVLPEDDYTHYVVYGNGDDDKEDGDAMQRPGTGCLDAASVLSTTSTLATARSSLVNLGSAKTIGWRTPTDVHHRHGRWYTALSMHVKRSEAAYSAWMSRRLSLLGALQEAACHFDAKMAQFIVDAHNTCIEADATLLRHVSILCGRVDRVQRQSEEEEKKWRDEKRRALLAEKRDAANRARRLQQLEMLREYMAACREEEEHAAEAAEQAKLLREEEERANRRQSVREREARRQSQLKQEIDKVRTRKRLEELCTKRREQALEFLRRTVRPQEAGVAEKRRREGGVTAETVSASARRVLTAQKVACRADVRAERGEGTHMTGTRRRGPSPGPGPGPGPGHGQVRRSSRADDAVGVGKRGGTAILRGRSGKAVAVRDLGERAQLYRMHTMTDRTVLRDPRQQLAMRLEEAGLSHSTYAATIAERFVPKQPAHMRSTGVV